MHMINYAPQRSLLLTMCTLPSKFEIVSRGYSLSTVVLRIMALYDHINPQPIIAGERLHILTFTSQTEDSLALLAFLFVSAVLRMIRFMPLSRAAAPTLPLNIT